MLKKANDLWDEFTTGKSKRKEQLSLVMSKKVTAMVANKMVQNMNSHAVKT